MPLCVMKLQQGPLRDHYSRDAGTSYFEVWGGGREKRLPGFKATPHPKQETSRILPTIFLEGPKLTYKNKQIKINDIDSRKLGGRCPYSFQVGSASCSFLRFSCPWDRIFIFS